MSRPYPSTVEDFRVFYRTYPKEELLEALAQLHVTNLEQLQKIQALEKELSDNAKPL
ncbi:hypothetical protein D3C72_2345550 [compost metagenome]